MTALDAISSHTVNVVPASYFLFALLSFLSSLVMACLGKVKAASLLAVLFVLSSAFVDWAHIERVKAFGLVEIDQKIEESQSLLLKVQALAKSSARAELYPLVHAGYDYELLHRIAFAIQQLKEAGASSDEISIYIDPWLSRLPRHMFLAICAHFAGSKYMELQNKIIDIAPTWMVSSLDLTESLRSSLDKALLLLSLNEDSRKHYRRAEDEAIEALEDAKRTQTISPSLSDYLQRLHDDRFPE